MKKLIFICLTFVGSGALAQSASGSSLQTYASGGLATAQGVKFGSDMQKPCTSGTWAAAYACPVMVLSYASAAATLVATLKDSNTGSSVGDGTCSDPTFCATTSGDTTPSATTSPGTGGGWGTNLPPDAQQAINQAASQGYTYNPADGTVTTPSGTYPAAAFGSGTTMAAAGIIPQDQAAAVDKALKDAKSAIVSMPIAGGGGGAASGGGVKVEYTDDGSGGRRGLGAIGKPKTAGLTRTLASGEAIGAQVDDIFRMITAKYQEKKRGNEFIP